MWYATIYMPIEYVYFMSYFPFLFDALQWNGVVVKNEGIATLTHLLCKKTWVQDKEAFSLVEHENKKALINKKINGWQCLNAPIFC